MRVGCVGAQGTGKTTAVEAFLQDPEVKARNWKFLPSAGRKIAEAGYKINQEADQLSQLLITAARVSGMYRMESQDPTVSVIADRTPLDALAYTAYQAAKVWKSEPNDLYWEISSGLVMSEIQNYDFVFYFPAYWAPKGTDIRSSDAEYQRDIDAIINKLLKTSAIEYYSIPNDCLKSRVDFMKGVIFS